MKIEDIKLMHGENLAQNASIEPNEKLIDYELSENLTYVQMISVLKGLNVISEFYDVKAACSIKGSNVTAVALGQSQADAVEKIMDSNPIDFLTSTIVISTEVDSEIARFLKNTNLIVVPSYSQKAIEILSMRDIPYITINTPLNEYKKYLSNDVKITPLGTLTQTPNLSELNKDLFKVVTKQKPTVEQIEDAIFAWKVVKHCKTDAAVVAKDLATLGISQSETSSAAAIDEALRFACERSKDAVLATDSIIYSQDAIYAAVQNRISLIIQPGGSHKDNDIIELADKYGITMIMTGIRNQRH
jgi:phosphoribosylaminoimidazolecarboxamide formyltransferase/IMP cyclohydrolase